MTTYRDQSNHLITVYSVNVSSASNTLAAAIDGKQIFVTEVLLIPDADSVKIRFKSGSNNISGLMNLSVAGNGFILPPVYKPNGDAHPHLVTNAGESLILTLDASVTVSGFVHYYYA